MSTLDPTASPPPQSMPMATLHATHGARFTPFCGYEVPADYGDESAEAEALRSGCGLIDRAWASLVEVSGADRVRFVNGLVTCDLAPLEPGTGTYGFFTHIKGRVISDATFLMLDDVLWMEIPGAHRDDVVAHASKYQIADQVAFGSTADARVPLTLVGPGTADVLTAAGVALPETPWQNVDATVHETDVRIVCEGRFGVAAWTLWVAADNAETLARALLATPGVRPVGVTALETVRVEQGRPRFGVDFDDGHFPQETGLEDETVSYTKGCYLGQEVVARIHYRGGVQRRLCGVRFAETVPVDGVELLHEGRAVGRVTSVVQSSLTGGTVGLGILHKRGAEIGTELVTADGTEATVVVVPFESPDA